MDEHIESAGPGRDPVSRTGQEGAPRCVPRVPLREPFATWPQMPTGAGATGAGATALPLRRSRTLVGVAAAAVVAVASGVGIGYGAFAGSQRPARSSDPATAASVSTVVAGVDAGLVDVNTVLGYTTARAAGTGMVLTSTGIVLTNNHVIEGATSISVTDVGNGRTYRAAVLGYDTTKDVAVLKLVKASGLRTVAVGNSSTVTAGQSVLGIGNAGGTGGTPHVAGGTVTALDQSITASDAGSARPEQLSDLIETNAAIESGDSGGPLVTSSGQVVGMDTAASSGGTTSGHSSTAAASQAYAIPINTAMAVATQIEGGSASSTVHIGTTAFLGVRVAPGASASGATGTFGGSATQGATVVGVQSGSPAQSGGLAAGDVITALDGTAVTSATGLEAQLQRDRPGQSVTVRWQASTGTVQRSVVTLTSGPAA